MNMGDSCERSLNFSRSSKYSWIVSIFMWYANMYAFLSRKCLRDSSFIFFVLFCSWSAEEWANKNDAANSLPFLSPSIV